MSDYVEFKALVLSYCSVATALGLTHDDVAVSLAGAVRFRRQCVSCCHSMAKTNGLERALVAGALPVFERACVFQHATGLQVCPFWQELEVPPDVLAKAQAELAALELEVAV